MKKTKSVYSASFTACALRKMEFDAVLPLLMSEDCDALIKREVEDNRLMNIRSEAARNRIILEFKKRYTTMPRHFWEQYQNQTEDVQYLYLYYNILKCYRVIFDIALNVVIPKSRSVDNTLQTMDVAMGIAELATREETIASWTEKTIAKINARIVKLYLEINMLDKNTCELKPMRYDNDAYSYFVQQGDTWFLDVCLLPNYQKQEIIDLWQ